MYNHNIITKITKMLKISNSSSEEFNALVSHVKEKFKEGNITVIRLRAFLSYHKFEDRDRPNTEKCLLLLDKFLNNEIKCIPKEDDDISKYITVKEKIKELNNIDEIYDFLPILKDVDIYNRMEEYIKTDSRYKYKHYDKVKDFYDIMKKCNNNVPKTASTLFYGFIQEMASKNIVIYGYKDMNKTFILICENKHQYCITKSRLENRIRENKMICGICGEDNHCKNPYLKNKKEKAQKRVEDKLIEKGLDIENYNKDTDKITMTCPNCDKKCEVFRTNFYKWKSCIKCINTVAGNKYTQKQVNNMLNTRGIYSSSEYISKDKSIDYNCPMCEKVIHTRLYEILNENICCMECQKEIYINVKKTTDIYNIDYTPKIKNTKELLKVVKLRYSKEEQRILNVYNVDAICNLHFKLHIAPQIFAKKLGKRVSSESFEKIKNSNKNVKYTIPKTNLRNESDIVLQGYEPRVMDIIVKYIDEEIIVDSTWMPSITYRSMDGRLHNYFPDIYIPHKKLLIECKSTYTFYKESFNTICKMYNVLALGYNTELWVLSNKKTHIFFLHPKETTFYVTKGDFYSALETKYKSYESYGNYAFNIDNTSLINFHDNIMNLVSTVTKYEYFDKIKKPLDKLEEKFDSLNINENIEINSFEIDINKIKSYFINNNINIPLEDCKNIMNKTKNDKEYKEYIIKLLTKFSPPTFPQKFIDENTIEKDLLNFKNNKTEGKIEKDTHVVKSNTLGIKFLNFFMIDEILKCKTNGNQNIYEVWNDLTKREYLWKRVVSNDKASTVTPTTLTQRFAYCNGRAYNFPPNVAKYVYNHFKAKNVLDFCAGYGGRLLGFWGSKAQKYIGIDPNTNNNYKGLIDWLNENDYPIFDEDTKEIKIINQPAEDVDYSKLGEFDLIFTSPPYYNLEVYSDQVTQSCNRYKSYNEWFRNFLAKTIDKTLNVLSMNGHILINIKNIKGYNIADDMVRYMNKKSILKQKGSLSMSQTTISKDKDIKEYIFVFQKVNE